MVELEVRSGGSDPQYWTDEQLADSIIRQNLLIDEAQTRRGRVEMELTRRLEARGARELAHPTLEVKLVYPTPTYETAKLMLLAEQVPLEDFDLAYQPPWVEVKHIDHAARFDGRYLNTLARKFGDPVAALLEQAKLPSSPKLVVREKAEGGENHRRV